MPAKSKAQQRLMQAAEHGANFPMAQQVRASMTHRQLHDFAVGSERDKPEHVNSHVPHAAKHVPRATSSHVGKRHHAGVVYSRPKQG